MQKVSPLFLQRQVIGVILEVVLENVTTGLQFLPGTGHRLIAQGNRLPQDPACYQPPGSRNTWIPEFLFISWATERKCVRLNWIFFTFVLFLLHSSPPSPNLLISLKIKICGLFFKFCSSSFHLSLHHHRPTPPPFFFFWLKLWLDMSQIFSVTSKLDFWWTDCSKALLNSTQWE